MELLTVTISLMKKDVVCVAKSQYQQHQNRHQYITAELGRALAVVKVTFQVNGNSQFLGVCPQKNYGSDKNKIWYK